MTVVSFLLLVNNVIRIHDFFQTFENYKENSYSLDCKEGHMKKNRLCVCVHLGSKEHRFKKSLIVTNDGWNLVGP